MALGKKIRGFTGSALSAPYRAVQKARGTVADIKRGHLLHKQGYGTTYESAMKKAKTGKTGYKKKRK